MTRSLSDIARSPRVGGWVRKLARIVRDVGPFVVVVVFMARIGRVLCQAIEDVGGRVADFCDAETRALTDDAPGEAPDTGSGDGAG